MKWPVVQGMTDKPSERVSGRPPMPSIAPPTDEIDSDWGADDIPAPAPVPQLGQTTPSVAPAAATPVPPRASSTPAPRPSAAPAAPRPSSSPAPRPSSAPATSTPLVATSNPLRKQTLLGIAPVIPRSEPPAAAPSQPPAAGPSQPPAAPPPPAVSAPSAPPVGVASDNPLRKQTLLGIAPVLPSAPPPAAEVTAAPAPEPAAAPAAERAQEPAFEPAPSVPALVTPPVTVATDAPTTSDVPAAPVPSLKPRSREPVSPAVDLSSSQDELPAFKKARPRWLLPLSAAAVIAIGVVGLRSLDRAPTPVPAELAHPHTPSKATSKALGSLPKDGDEGDDDDGPSTGDDDAPEPSQPEPEPLKGKANATPAPSAPTSAASSPASSAPTTAPATGAIRIQVASEPPGARMFWRGKEVGTTPFVLELQPGEKHAYELGLPGYTTRKVVIDGSKTEISVGLRPDPKASTGASPRK